MKKQVLSFVTIFLLCISCSACNARTTDNQNEFVETEAGMFNDRLNDQSIKNQMINGTDSQNGVEEFVCHNVDFIDFDGTGVAYSYEDMQDIIGVYADKMNFVSYEIIDICSEEEQRKIKGTENNNSTLYKAHIEYDYLNNVSVDKTIYLSKAGDSKIQPENQPIYKIGERYASMLMNLSYDSWNVALSELTFAIKRDAEEDFLYQIKFDFMKFYTKDGVALGEDIQKDMQFEYTSTDNNPVKYVRKYKANELSEFFREDWLSRNYTINLLDNAIFDTDIFGYEYTEDGDVIPIESIG